MSTIFTQVIAGEIPGTFVWADEQSVAFATIEPITPGHMLVVPRAEVDQFSDLDDESLAHLSAVAARIGRAQRAAFGAPRAALLAAGFEIPHAHLHVLPAWDEQALTFANARSVPAAEIAANARLVRDALIAAGHGDHVPPDPASPELTADR